MNYRECGIAPQAAERISPIGIDLRKVAIGRMAMFRSVTKSSKDSSGAVVEQTQGQVHDITYFITKITTHGGDGKKKVEATLEAHPDHLRR